MKGFILTLLICIALVAVAQSVNAYIKQGNQHYRQAQYDLAEAQFKHTLALDPNFPVLNLRLAQFHSFQGNFEQAKSEFEKAPGFIEKVEWQPGRDGFYKALLAVSNGADDAEESLAAIAIGDKDRAIQSLERMAIAAPQDAGNYVRRPEFEPLQSEPRFHALLARMNLQP